MQNKKYDLNYLRCLRDEWEKPCFDAVPEDKKAEYQSRVKAVDMYIDGIPNSIIEKVTGINSSHISRHIKYCLSENDEGKCLGYEGLIPYVHKKENIRNNNSESSSGQFKELLSNYPELKDLLVGNYFGDKKYTLERVMSFTALHRKFLLKCRDLGIGEDDYPFNTTSMAYMSLRRYMCFLSDKNSNLQEKRLDKNAKQIQKSTGINTAYTKTAVIPYSVVQIDGHIIDVIYTAEVELDDGRIVRRECTRCWLIAVIDVATRCILGYTVSQEFNYNQYDILKAIRNSILPHKNIDYTIKGLKSPDRGGFPNNTYKEIEYALFDTIMLDNAKSHLAYNVLDKLCMDLKCTVDFGSVSTPETRGIIERFFGTIETRGFHRLVSTTGSNSRDVKRQNPEKEAVKYAISFDEVCEIVENLIEQYNNTPHESLFNRSPLEELGEKLENGMKPYICNESEVHVVDELLWMNDTRVVKGGKKTGRRPYIHFLGANYRNTELSSDYSLIGEKLTILYNPADISTIKAYLPNGKCIGELVAVGEYGRVAHSVKSRKEMSKYARENKRNNGIFSTPVTDYENHLKEKAKKSRHKRTKSDILRREMGKPEPRMQEKNYAEIIDLKKEYPRQTAKLSSAEIMNSTSEAIWDKINGGVI